MVNDTNKISVEQVRKVPGSKRHRYDIYKTKVMAYTGITEWPEGEEKT